jgi:uncharacterized membrane protein YedE/YeeE
MSLAPYLALGTFFGIVLVKSEVVSWFRIQQMFRFQSFHMYGVIMTAVLVAGISLELLRRSGRRGPDGAPLGIPPKEMGSGLRYALGGTLFGIGWSLTGACPGPLFALLGAGISVMIVPIATALFGTWLYGLVRSRLPH